MKLAYLSDWHLEFLEGHPLERYFQVDAERPVPDADAWTFGHTHHDLDLTIAGCRVVSAQVGHPGETH